MCSPMFALFRPQSEIEWNEDECGEYMSIINPYPKPLLCILDSLLAAGFGWLDATYASADCVQYRFHRLNYGTAREQIVRQT